MSYDIRRVLWANVCAMMQTTEPTVDAVHKRTGVGHGTVQRMRNAETYIQLDTLSRLAQSFGLQEWQLLVPNLAPDALPILAPQGPGNPLARATEPTPEYALPSNDDLVTRAMAKLLAQVPDDARAAVAEIIGSWAKAGGDEPRRRALVSLLQIAAPPTT